MKKVVQTVLKLAAVAGILFAVGTALTLRAPTVEQPVPEVEEAEADILVGFGRDGREFDRAVEALGMKPRPYDFNGNVMYFANKAVQGAPYEVANIIQDTLVDHGVNSRNYMQVDTVGEAMQQKDGPHQNDSLEMAKSMLVGEVVPTVKERNLIEMSGVVGPSVDEFNAYARNLGYDEAKNVNYRELTNGYRWFEIRGSEEKGKSEVLAVWTDNSFDTKKMENDPRAEQSPPDETVPACVGCVRDRKFKPLSEEEPYSLNKWKTQAGVDETYNFYRRAMANRGWSEAGVQPKLNKLAEHIPEIANAGGRALTLEKDGRVISITVLQSGHGAEIFSLEKFQDTQPTLNTIKDAVEEQGGLGTLKSLF